MLNYFGQRLSSKPTKKDRDAAAIATLHQYPELLDYYIRLREESGDQAESRSLDMVNETLAVFVEQIKRVVDDLKAKTDFYQRGWSSYDEALARVQFFKQYIENQDGWKLINRQGEPFSKEKDVQLYFGLVWFGSIFDINREANNGRGPVDYKVSIGAADKSLIEFKLASNSQLKRNLEKQVVIYEKANQTATSVTVIICYAEADQVKVTKLLTELELNEREDIVVIDARSDNKPTGSMA